MYILQLPHLQSRRYACWSCQLQWHPTLSRRFETNLASLPHIASIYWGESGQDTLLTSELTALGWKFVYSLHCISLDRVECRDTSFAPSDGLQKYCLPDASHSKPMSIIRLCSAKIISNPTPYSIAELGQWVQAKQNGSPLQFNTCSIGLSGFHLEAHAQQLGLANLVRQH